MENENQKIAENEKLENNRKAIISYFVKGIKNPTVDKVLDAVSLAQSVFGCPLEYTFKYNLETLEVESDAKDDIATIIMALLGFNRVFKMDFFTGYFSKFYNSEFVTKHRDRLDEILRFINTRVNDVRLRACLYNNEIIIYLQRMN